MINLIEDINADLDDQFNYVERRKRETLHELLKKKNEILSDKEEFHKYVADFIIRKRFVTSEDIEIYLKSEKIDVRMDFDSEILKKFNVVKAERNFWSKDIDFLEFQRLFPEIFPYAYVRELLTYEEVSSWDMVRPAGFAMKTPWGYKMKAGVYRLKKLNGMPIPFTEFAEEFEEVKEKSFDVRIPQKCKGNDRKKLIKGACEKVDMRYFFGSSPEYVFKYAR